MIFLNKILLQVNSLIGFRRDYKNSITVKNDDMIKSISYNNLSRFNLG